MFVDHYCKFKITFVFCFISMTDVNVYLFSNFNTAIQLFNNLVGEEEIKNKGWPTPDLNIIQITKCKTREYIRKFKNDLYLYKQNKSQITKICKQQLFNTICNI